MADTIYQNVNFHFRVNFTLSTAKSVDVGFQSVTGLDSTIDTETIREGGENRFEHVLPTRRKYGPLILKRGLLGPDSSGVTTWLKQTFDEEKYQPLATVNIYLLGETHKPILHWTINNVWPRSWKIGELNAERGEVLLETLELNYNRLIFAEKG
ncbi:phage tail protein [Puia sp. P3]|uniref:phage tail protein n=1 Tax=Puia sp. P3 TaxID=3423952 RepID=UPI003D674FE6